MPALRVKFKPRITQVQTGKCELSLSIIHNMINQRKVRIKWMIKELNY